MEELKVFSNEELGNVRILEIDGEPWFVGKDVVDALGYVDSFGALKKHVDIEDKQNCQNNSFKTARGMTIINESGLYSLILSSKLPNAKKFKRWVTTEVLPAIRKTGSYSVGDQISQLSNIEARLSNMEKLIQDMKNGSVLSAEIQVLTKSKSAKTKLPQRVTALENDWYEKNKKRIWKACEEYEVTHSMIYHSILKKCSEQYDLELAKEIYYQEVGGYPKFMMDLVSYFPELEEIADAFLHSIR